MQARMNKFEKISEARDILGLPETATLAQIKTSYRNLLTKWHPDKNSEDQGKCADMTRKIIAAYETIMDYCGNYEYSFTKEMVNKSLSPEEWWTERFGDDPIWGRARKSG